VRTDRLTIVPPPKGDPAEYRTLWAEVQHEVGYLTRRLTNRLREEVYLRFGGYYRSGKINMAKLWKQRLGNFRLFQRATSGSEHWLAISMLVDESASMKGQDKYLLATKTALLLGETLEQLGVPFEVIGFTTSEYEARAAMSLGLLPAHEYRTTRCSPLEHRVYKNFNEPYRFVRRRLTGIEPRHNNWDEEHLHFAFRRLQSRSEDRKLMIIVSDGQPNGDAEHLIETVRLIERLGTRVIAIGVGADYVCKIYSEAIVVEDFRQLAEDLFQLLTREISGGVQHTEVQSSHYAFAGTAT
jgi:cobalamin biosynthesis protein CobT